MARDDDDEQPAARKKRTFETKPLDGLSIAELEDYVTDLKGEIIRAEETIRAKQSVRAGADSLFGKKKS